MELNKKNRRLLRLQGAGFALLFLCVVGLLGWLSTRYHVQADWTAAGRHTLTPASTAVLDTLQGQVTVTAFARDSELTSARNPLRDFVGRYQRHKKDLTLKFINPDLEPDRVREYGVSREGEMVIEYQGRRENVTQPDEEVFTNALQRLARSGERRLVFIQGHGERKPLGQANHDLGNWGRQLETKGLRPGKLNLAETPAIPDDTAVLVLAGPRVDLLPGEVTLIRDYVAQGGNLLWLGDPGPLHGLAPLARDLGLSFQPGVIVDPTTQVLGIGNPTFAVVADYPPHPTSDGLDSLSLFPTAAGIKAEPPEGWRARPLLRTVPRAWSETGPISGTLAFDQGRDVAGPLMVGQALSRELAAKNDESKRTQRVVVVGDGDFLSNAYLGNGANLELGNRLVNWLSHEDSFIRIPTRAVPDGRLELSTTATVILGVGFLLVLPALLLGSGVFIWYRRRRR